MKFKSEKDREQIEKLSNLRYGFITGIVRRILLEKKFKAKEKGRGLARLFEVYKEGFSVRANFYLHNLFLEIATKDRDAEALEFDERLVDLGYFLSRTLRLVESKIKPLLLAMSEENPKKGIEEIMKLAPKYERLRVLWRDKDS